MSVLLLLIVVLGVFAAAAAYLVGGWYVGQPGEPNFRNGWGKAAPWDASQREHEEGVGK